MATVEVPDETLRKAMELARTDSASAAVLRALEEFARKHGQAHLIEYLGTFEGFITPEELRQMRERKSGVDPD